MEDTTGAAPDDEVTALLSVLREEDAPAETATAGETPEVASALDDSATEAEEIVETEEAAEAAEVTETPPAPAPFKVVDDTEARAQAAGARWFVVNTYAKNEKHTRDNLDHVRERMGEELFFEVVIPEEDYQERVGKSVRPARRPSIPGYLLVRIVPDDEVVATILNTEGVVGLLGIDRTPKPISDKEAEAMLGRNRKQTAESDEKEKIPFHRGDKVVVIAGPFENISGEVSEIDTHHYQVCVLLPFLGNSTPVWINAEQIMLERD